MRYKVYVYSILLTLALLACDEYGDVENVIVSREPTRQIFTPALTVSIDKTELEAEGGSLTLTVTSNTKWVVYVSEWCTCSLSSGSGNGVVTISATENPETAVRTGEVAVTADGVAPQQFTITQKSKPISDIPSPGDNIPPA